MDRPISGGIPAAVHGKIAVDMGDIAACHTTHAAEVAAEIPATGAIGQRHMDCAVDRGIARQGPVVAGHGGIGRQSDAAAGDGPHIGEIATDEQRGVIRHAVEGPADIETSAVDGQGQGHPIQPRIPDIGIIGIQGGIQSGDAAAGSASDIDEITAHVEQAVCQQQGLHHPIGGWIPGSGAVRVDGIGIQGGDMAACCAADDGEIAPRIEQAITGGEGQGPHHTVGGGIPAGHGAAGGVHGGQPAAAQAAKAGEGAADIEPPPAQSQGMDRGVGVGLPAAQRRPVSDTHSGQAAAACSSKRSKIPTDVECGTIGGQDQGAHRGIGVWIPGRGNPAGGIQGRQAAAIHTSDSGEIPAHIEGLAISGQHQGTHDTIGSGIPQGVHTAVRPDMQQIAACEWACAAELTAHEPAPGAIGHHRMDLATDHGITAVQQHRRRIDDHPAAGGPAGMGAEHGAGIDRPVGHPQPIAYRAHAGLGQQQCHQQQAGAEPLQQTLVRRGLCGIHGYQINQGWEMQNSTA